MLWTALKIVLALILGAFVVSRTDLDGLVALKDRISPVWLAAVSLLFVSLTLLKALQYYFLLGRRVGYFRVLHVVIIQNAVSNFIATSAGIASYLTIFHLEHDVKLSRSALAFLLAKVGDLISIWFLLVVASLWVWGQIEPYHLLVETLLILLAGVILVFLLAVLSRKRFVAALRGLLARSGLDRIGLVLRSLETLQAIAQQPQSLVFRSIGTAVVFSMVYLLVTMGWLYAGLRTFSLQIPVMTTVFVNTLLQLISYVPIQAFGGLGVTEFTSLYLYQDVFHITQVDMAAVLIGIRVVFYLLNLGVLAYLPAEALWRREEAPAE
ncbi:MAG: lysylphosphatidylglycerol synthase domain-containing protein [Bacteroidota bacterium]